MNKEEQKDKKALLSVPIGENEQILSDYAAIIIGRMGLPYREKDISVISLIVDGTTDALGALTGKLGNLPHVTVKSALTKSS